MSESEGDEIASSYSDCTSDLIPSETSDDRAFVVPDDEFLVPVPRLRDGNMEKISEVSEVRPFFLES